MLPVQSKARKMPLKRRVWVEVDLGKLRKNYARIAAAVKPAKVLCVMKANAYGLGVGPYAAALATTDCAGFGVAEPFEALQLLNPEFRQNLWHALLKAGALTEED